MTQSVEPILEFARFSRTPFAVKPMKGLSPGVYEIALAYRSDAYRTIYAVKPGEDIRVVHAFQKKSTKGIKTPKKEVDLIRSRISQLKEQLR